MLIELTDAAAVSAHLRKRADLQNVVVQNVDLTSLADELASVPAAGAFFLGCRFAPAALAHVIDTGGTVFPRLSDLPYKPYRNVLYSPDELMEGYVPGKPGSMLEDTRDGRIYHYFRRHNRPGVVAPIIEALAQRIHDHAIDDALQELLTPRKKIVGIMGGHAMKRDDPAYLTVAQLARRLTLAGYFIATGGGPGAMEAGSLGAWFAAYEAEDLEEAVELLRQETAFLADQYMQCAYVVRDKFPDGAANLAVPTWCFGHEPTNLFAPHVAKYFANSIREDGLLAICTHGVVYAPGSAGTMQEVFQKAAQNQYGLFSLVSPMVFFDREFWLEKKPVYPLAAKLAEPHQYGEMMTVADDIDAIVAFIQDHPPVEYQKR